MEFGIRSYYDGDMLWNAVDYPPLWRRGYSRGDHHEYGKATFNFVKESKIFEGMEDNQVVWMSHADRVQKLPEGFEVIGVSENSPYAGIADEKRDIYAFQFHPEVHQQKRGQNYLKICKNICGCESTWEYGKFCKREDSRYPKTGWR